MSQPWSGRRVLVRCARAALVLLVSLPLFAAAQCDQNDAEDAADKAKSVGEDVIAAAQKAAREAEAKRYHLPLNAAKDEGYQPGQGDHIGRDKYAIDYKSSDARVYPTRPGTVAWAGYNCQTVGSQPYCYGNAIVIEHEGGVYSLYSHLEAKPTLKPGTSVDLSTQIGMMGESGCKGCGKHVHFVVRRMAAGVRAETALLFPGEATAVDVRGQIVPRP